MALTCPNGHDNPDDFRFCGQCGAAFASPEMVRCSHGHENPADDRFCGTCGEPLASSRGRPSDIASSEFVSASQTGSESSAPPSTQQELDKATQRRGNAMAVAALVLGIVGAIAGLIPLLFFFALSLGVLAVAFGLIGRSVAQREPRRSGRGQAIAGTILGGLACILGIVGIVIVAGVFSSVDRALREAAGPAPASSYQIAVVSSERDIAGVAHGRGTVSNTSDHRRGYLIRIEFVDPSGARIGQASQAVEVEAGQAAAWEVVDAAPGTAPLQCRVVSVDNVSPSSATGSTARKPPASSLPAVPTQPGVATSPVARVGPDNIIVTAAGTSATVAKADTSPPTPLVQLNLTFDVDTRTPIQMANIDAGTYPRRYFLVTLIGGDTRLGALIGQRNGQWTLIPVQSHGAPSFWTEGLEFAGPTGL
jgi:hypothetical protein